MVRSSKVFDKFMKKHNIENLEAFRSSHNFEYVENMMKRKIETSK